MHFAKLTLEIVLMYLLLLLVAHLFFSNFFSHTQFSELTTKQGLEILPFFLFSIGLIFTIGIYLFNSWLAKKWLKLQWSKVILFMGIMAAAGPIGEIVGSAVWRALWGQSLWVYILLPVHSGDTSIVMSAFWPIYGFHIYCFHTALKTKHDITEDADLSLLFGIDAITVEVIVNLMSLSFFYTYVFYYLTGDLWHLSTALVFIPYVIFGYVCVKTLHFWEKKHYHLIIGLAGFILGWSIIFYNLKF